jgi:hypothetical protein
MSSTATDKSSNTGANATTNTSTNSNSSSSSSLDSNYRLPSDVTLKHASRLAIVEDKPIMLDYWTNSLDEKALVGVKETGEKLLVKTEEEYTSTIVKFYKSGGEFIVITENSIYIVSNTIPTRKIR